MKTVFYRCIIVCIAVSICFLHSCKKETEENTSSTQLLPKKTNVKVFEAVSVEVKNFDVTDDSLQGSFGNFPIVVYNLRNNLAFVVPDVAEGTYELNLLGQKLSFNVTKQQPVADPDAYVSNLIANITIDNTTQAAIIAKLDSAKARNPAVDVASVVANFNKLQQIKTDAQNQFAALSPAEKQTLAQIFAANQDLIDTLNQINTSLTDLALSFKTEDYPENSEIKYRQNIGKWILAAGALVLTIPQGVALGSVVAGPLGTAAGLITAGLILAKSLPRLSATLNQIMAAGFRPVNNFNAYKTTTNISAFDNGVARELIVSTDYENINSNTVNYMSGNSLVAQFVNSVSDFVVFFNKINSWFNLALDGNPQPVSQWTNVVTENKRVHANYLSITNISNPNVTVTVNNNQGALMLTFNTSAPLPQDFDFDLVYNDPGFASYTNTFTTSISDPCAGANINLNVTTNGLVATAVATGGTQPYNFNWNNGASTTNTYSDLSAPHNVTVTVTDANGCTAVKSDICVGWAANVLQPSSANCLDFQDFMFYINGNLAATLSPGGNSTKLIYAGSFTQSVVGVSTGVTYNTSPQISSGQNCYTALACCPDDGNCIDLCQ